MSTDCMCCVIRGGFVGWRCAIAADAAAPAARPTIFTCGSVDGEENNGMGPTVCGWGTAIRGVFDPNKGGH